MSIIQKILKEATLEKDMEQYQTAKKYMEKAFEFINNFPNKHVEYNPVLKEIGVSFGAFTFYFWDHYSPSAKLYNTEGVHAAYDMRNNTFNIFNVSIEYDKKTNKLSLYLDGKDNELIHELIHFLDLKRSGNKGTKRKLNKLADEKKSRVDIDEYSNDPYELNAHFKEYVMPVINKYIANKHEIPKDFTTFKNEIMKVFSKDQFIKRFYNHMTPENKKKFVKRIAVYYQSLKDFVLKEPDVKFDNDSTSLEIQKDVLQKFFGKIKNLFRSKNAA